MKNANIEFIWQFIQCKTCNHEHTSNLRTNTKKESSDVHWILSNDKLIHTQKDVIIYNTNNLQKLWSYYQKELVESWTLIWDWIIKTQMFSCVLKQVHWILLDEQNLKNLP